MERSGEKGSSELWCFNERDSPESIYLWAESVGDHFWRFEVRKEHGDVVSLDSMHDLSYAVDAPRVLPSVYHDTIRRPRTILGALKGI